MNYNNHNVTGIITIYHKAITVTSVIQIPIIISVKGQLYIESLKTNIITRESVKAVVTETNY